MGTTAEFWGLHTQFTLTFGIGPRALSRASDSPLLASLPVR